MKAKITETRNAETVTISRAEYELFQAQSERISALEKQVELLTEALRLSRQKRFGASSERTSEDAMEQLSLLFNEAEVYADQAVEEDDGSVAVAAHKRHKNTNIPWSICLRMYLWKWWNTVFRRKNEYARNAGVP